MKKPFDNPNYIFELKHDGWRAMAYIEHGICRLMSRNLRTLRFDVLSEALAKLPVESAVIDGGIVYLDANGVSRFNRLLSHEGRRQAVLYAFDLVFP